jgi:hypothetical protein
MDTQAAEPTAERKPGSGRGRPFQKGQPRPAGAGRKKGSLNVASRAYKDFLRELFDSKEYRDKLEAMFTSGAILASPHLHATLAAHAHGKPVPAEPQVADKPPLLFITQHPLGSWDPLKDKAAALAARKTERLLPEAKPDAYTPPDPADPDALVVIEPEPSTVAAAMIRPAGR